MRPHAGSIAQRLSHGDEGVRKAALELFAKLEPAAMAPYLAKVTSCLADENQDVRRAAVASIGGVEAGGRT